MSLWLLICLMTCLCSHSTVFLVSVFDVRNPSYLISFLLLPFWRRKRRKKYKKIEIFFFLYEVFLMRNFSKARKSTLTCVNVGGIPRIITTIRKLHSFSINKKKKRRSKNWNWKWRENVNFSFRENWVELSQDKKRNENFLRLKKCCEMEIFLTIYLGSNWTEMNAIEPYELGWQGFETNLNSICWN